ncbi:MAG: glycosyltransferase [Vicinamibacterales bacterium]
MNVLHVIPAVAPRYGGPSVAVARMCAALQQTGVHVTLATSDADGRGRLAVELARETQYHGIPAIFFSRAASEAFKWTPALTRWLRENVGRFDIVHIHAVFSHACLAAGHAARRGARPYLVRPLGSLDPWSLRRHRFRKRLLLSSGARLLLRHAEALHYTSSEEQRQAEIGLRNLAPGVVIPLGVDDEFFEPSIGRTLTPSEPYVLSLSRLDPKKGVDLLIESFHGLGDAAGSWRLLIAGDGEPDYVAHLRGLAERGARRGSIEFKGWVDGTDRLRLVRGASLYVLPSEQENFGISVVESMACGVPVLVSPGVNLAADIHRSAAGWIVERNPAAWSDALKHAMDSSEERAGRGARARDFATRFRWNTVAARLATFYEDVLQTRAGRFAAGAIA